MPIHLTKLWTSMAGTAALCCCSTALTAQVLEEVIVTARRIDEPSLRVPLAVSLITQDTLQNGRQQLGLDEALARVPGVFFQNRYNFAQDLRISMRGFGARADFGIRGVKIYIDEIPATLPDGQGGVDGIDIGALERAEILRGPASTLYGTAAGGVIRLSTEDGGDKFVEGRVTLGEYDMQKFQLKAGGGHGSWRYYASASHTGLDGYRAFSDNDSWNLNTKVAYRPDDSLLVTAVFSAVDSPIANDAGSLTAAQVAANRRQARSTNVQFDTGESLEQYRGGVVVQKRFGEVHDVQIRAFGLTQDFETRIPSAGGVPASNGGWVEFDRLFSGASGEYIYSGDVAGHKNRLTLGFEVAFQDDDRLRYVNLNGARGPLSFDQTEKVSTYGLFLQDEWFLSDALSATAGVRLDIVDFEVDDRFLLNTSGDDSGSRDFDELSPVFGLVWNPQPWISLYGNVSTSFETPTTTEFANPGGGGFNPDLVPQTSTNYEFGVKGVVEKRVRYELVAFTIDTKDELIPFEIPGDARQFFENAGSSTRKGIEASVSAQVIPDLTATLSYTYSDFTFDRFVSSAGQVFDGKRLPGIPRHQVFAELAYRHPAGLYAIWDILGVGGLYADNANATRIEGYQVSTLRVGHEWQAGSWHVSPFVGVNNLFDEAYNGNVRVNAFGARYFEPAPDLNVFGGFTIRHSWE